MLASLAVGRSSLLLKAVTPRKTRVCRASTTAMASCLKTKAPAGLKFIAGVAPLAENNVLIGQKSRLLEFHANQKSELPQGDIFTALVEAAAGASEDNGGSSTTLWQTSLPKPAKLTVAALPALCSRHNSPAQPHAAAALLGPAVSSKDVSVTLVIPPEHALASACALARALPKFNAKSGKPGAEPAPPATVTAGFATAPDAALSDATLSALAAAAEATRLAAEIVDTPPEQMNTDAFRALAKSIAGSLGPSVTFEETVGADLAAKGFGGIWGVGKAAEQPPALVVLTYTPEGTPTGHVAWVGKGIVYDTGGLALKTREGMCGMKSDCAGAAAMLGAFQAAVRCKAPQKISLVLCLAENAIGPGAFRNDDILTLFSGKTVEINNTDAEGRLVLGDGVAFASQVLRPDLIVDMATLTGAQLVATGKRHAGVVANTEEVELAAVAAGKRSGDLVHPLPYCPEAYRGEFSSKVADLRNSVRDRSNAQSSCAAIFIAEHLAADWKGGWLHVDMAGPAWGERGTGYGVGLLLSLLSPKSLEGAH